MVQNDAVPQPPRCLNAGPREACSNQRNEADSQHGKEGKGEGSDGDARLVVAPRAGNSKQANEDHHVKEQGLRDRVKVGAAREEDEREGERQKSKPPVQERIASAPGGRLFSRRIREHRPDLYRNSGTTDKGKVLAFSQSPNPNPKFTNRQGAKNARKMAHSRENRRNL
jgi:hypothetical protein